MRQAGVLAAAADHALTHHVERLAEDHVHAKSLAAGLASIEGLQLAQQTTDTNIVLFQVDPAIGTAAEFVAELANSGVQMLAVAQDRVRAVTHLDVSHSRVTEAIETVQRVLDQLRQT